MRPAIGTGDMRAGIIAERLRSKVVTAKGGLLVSNLARPLDEVLREMLIEAQRRCMERPDPDSKAERLKILRAFKDFVLYGKTPED